jgi:hypothetical protein
MILTAGLLAGLAGTTLLAQTATQEEAPATETPEAATPEADTQASAERAATGTDEPGDFAPRRGRGTGVPGLAPLETYNADGDGTVTQEEIETGRAERFAGADVDGDGALSAGELIAMEEAIQEELRLARAAAVVTRMDDNGDGLLQAEELEARTPQIAPLFDELDSDGDGGISLAEMEAGRPQRGEGGFGRGGHGRGHAGGTRGGFRGGLFGG